MSKVTTYFDKQNALLEPDALLPIVRYPKSVFIPDDKTLYLMASWGTQLSGVGRMDVRNPSTPMSLRGVTLCAFKNEASFILLDPDIPTYENSEQLYYDRLNEISELPVKVIGWTGSSQVWTPLLPGSYGAIITRVYNNDYNYICLGLDRTLYNTANELGDSTMDYQRNDNSLLYPISKWTTSEAIQSLYSNPITGQIAGSICYVLLSKSWSMVPDPLAPYMWRDDFTGALDNWSINQSQFGNVQIDPSYQWLKVLGHNDTWGLNGAISSIQFERERQLIFDIYPGNSATTNVISGWTSGDDYSYTSFQHGVQFNSIGSIQIYENGLHRGVVANYTVGGIYRVRITTHLDGSATYEIQGGKEYPPIRSDVWKDITPSVSYSPIDLLRIGFSQQRATSAYVSDVRVK